MKISFSLFLFAILTIGAAGQGASDDPGHKMFSTVSGVRFSVPKGTTLEKISDASIAFMSERNYNVAEFVAVPTGTIDEGYLSKLASTVTAQMYPKENPFRWKLIPAGTPGLQKSKYQTSEGDIKGFSKPSSFVEISYVVITVNGKTIVTGYLTGLGEKNGAKIDEAESLFEGDDASGGSMSGLYALAHVIASITGEKYTNINPGIVLEAPVPNPR